MRPSESYASCLCTTTISSSGTASLYSAIAATTPVPLSDPLSTAIELINGITGTHFSKTNRTELLAFINKAHMSPVSASGDGTTAVSDIEALTQHIHQLFNNFLSQVTLALAKLSQQAQDATHEPPAPSPTPAPSYPSLPSPFPPHAGKLKVVVSMLKVDWKFPVRALTLAQLKMAINKALAKSALHAKGLNNVKVHSVRKLANGDVLIHQL